MSVRGSVLNDWRGECLGGVAKWHRCSTGCFTPLSYQDWPETQDGNDELTLTNQATENKVHKDNGPDMAEQMSITGAAKAEPAAMLWRAGQAYCTVQRSHRDKGEIITIAMRLILCCDGVHFGPYVGHLCLPAAEWTDARVPHSFCINP